MKPRPPGGGPRLPREPYPGLRPFLDYESVLLFGRDRQVQDLIGRLRDTRFVAVIGGSGSGKSSLILAGLVPELRSFGIPGAGDFWMPMVCTPGTNVSVADVARNRFTPISRLAWKFSGLLKSRGSPEADAARIDEIAGVFRQDAGFARLVDTYTSELLVPPGPDPKEARLLFVIDQFEELFHPTNKGVADRELLVERVIDHFFNPHPRCYVVLTMRSEHLNDCAGYLELPDAINKSSYLVRRLDDDELREAIVGPAERFLTLRARDEAVAATLPEQVVFDPEVLDLVVRDTREISNDPDHLPLLQHLLARIWQTALAREGRPVPARLTMADLQAAIGGDGAAAERVNALRASLQNRAEAAYQTYDETQRGQLDALFVKLAFKDPNTGMYTQQRVTVDDCAAILGPGKSAEELRQLIARGFLHDVDYLFWDDENPARVTLKVSHESFIRGWARFRNLINTESERFEEFRNMLRNCSDWAARGRPADRLLDAGDLRRLDDADAASQLATPAARAAWLRFVLLDHDGERLVHAAPEIDDYLKLSLQRQAAAERGVRRMRRGRIAAVVVAAVLLPLAMFSLLIQQPVTKRAFWLIGAGSRSQNTPVPKAFVDVQQMQHAQKGLREAAALVDRAVVGDGPFTRMSQSLLVGLDFVGAVRRQSQLLDGMRSMVEPPINGQLRGLMTSALWDTETQTGADKIIRGEIAERDCVVPDPRNAGRVALVGGHLLTETRVEGRTRPARHLFVARGTPGFEDSVATFVATVEGNGCTAGDLVKSIPMFIDPYVVFDANLRYFIASQSSDFDDSASVTLYEIEWSRSEEGGSRVQTARDRAVLANKDAVARVKGAAGPERVGIVPTWRKPAGWAFDVGGQPWRMASPAAQLMSVDKAAAQQFAPLATAAAGSWCAEVGNRSSGEQPPGFTTTPYVHGKACFVITRGRPPGDTSKAPSALDEVIVAVYRQPWWGDEKLLLARLDDEMPSPLASMPHFARLPQKAEGTWHVGTDGAHAGWLVFQRQSASGEIRYFGAPWSTCALWRQGQDFLPAADRAAADDDTCQGR